MLRREDIPFGRENAATRSDLCRKTGLSDRKLRREIARLRALDDGTNIVIVSVSNGRGYYRTDNPEEIRHYIAEMTSRITGILSAVSVARIAADRLNKQQMYGEGLR